MDHPRSLAVRAYYGRLRGHQRRSRARRFPVRPDGDAAHPRHPRLRAARRPNGRPIRHRAPIPHAAPHQDAREAARACDPAGRRRRHDRDRVRRQHRHNAGHGGRQWRQFPRPRRRSSRRSPVTSSSLSTTSKSPHAARCMRRALAMSLPFRIARSPRNTGTRARSAPAPHNAA